MAMMSSASRSPVGGARAARERVDAPLGQPALDVERVVLLRPEHAGQRLAADQPLVVGQVTGEHLGVELVGLPLPLGDHLVEAGERIGPGIGVGQPEPYRRGPARPDHQGVMQGRLGAGAARIHRREVTVHHGAVDPVLDVGRVVGGAENTLVVRLVPGHQHGHRGFGVAPMGAQLRVLDEHRGVVGGVGIRGERREVGAARPRPGVPEPQRGQDMQDGLVRPTVVRGDPQEQILRRGLRVLHDDVEIAVAVEDSGVEQFVFGVGPASRSVDGDQVRIGEFRLRVFVQHFRVGRGRCGVQVEVAFFDVLAVVSLGVGQPEQPLLQNWIGAVPQTDRQAQQLPVVAEPGQPVLAPPVGPGSRLIVGERGPGIAAAVTLAHRAPLTLAEIRTPAAPRDVPQLGLGEALTFRMSRSFPHGDSVFADFGVRVTRAG
jgi:hypothetical protein